MQYEIKIRRYIYRYPRPTRLITMRGKKKPQGDRGLAGYAAVVLLSAVIGVLVILTVLRTNNKGESLATDCIGMVNEREPVQNPFCKK